MARIEALLRRSPIKPNNPNSTGQEIYRFGTVVLDVRKTLVTLDNRPVNLTAREFHLFCYFVEHQGITLSRDELLREVWGQKAGTLTRTVDVHVASLRQKLKACPKDPEMIITVSGIGYRFQS
jgi:DNA-binding response OmpR family regulator